MGDPSLSDGHPSCPDSVPAHQERGGKKFNECRLGKFTENNMCPALPSSQTPLVCKPVQGALDLHKNNCPARARTRSATHCQRQWEAEQARHGPPTRLLPSRARLTATSDFRPCHRLTSSVRCLYGLSTRPRGRKLIRHAVPSSATTVTTPLAAEAQKAPPRESPRALRPQGPPRRAATVAPSRTLPRARGTHLAPAPWTAGRTSALGWPLVVLNRL